MASLVLILMSDIPVATSYSQDIRRGPYIDDIIYKVMISQDQRFLDLQSGDIDMDSSYFDPVHYPAFEENEKISIYTAIRNGYGHITINCDKYPLNISGFRRAFAFAFDKTRIAEDRWDGFSVEHDSLVPSANGWCIENQLEWHYYTAQPDIGNQILDDLNFSIDSESGFRLAPNGIPFDIILEYIDNVPSIALRPPKTIMLDAFDSLHINASVRGAHYFELNSRLDNHGDYDMAYYTPIDFHTNDVEWLAYDYWSEYADVPYQNPSNFRNSTYDSWRDRLLHGTTYEEVYEAAAEMQRILQYNVPRLVIYENTYCQAYRNDRFTGHVEDLQRHISGLWTMRKIHKLDGTNGGTVVVSIGDNIDSFNIFVADSPYSSTIFDNLFPSLYKYGPDLKPVPDLTYAMIIENHSFNPSVQEGHTKFTIDIIQNATWSDGVPLTAYDIVFSFVYQYESNQFGNVAGADLSDLFAVYAPTPYRVILEFVTETYWHFNSFAFDYIIPEHIFNNDNGIGYDGWNTWNPIFNEADPFVTCGPFTLADFQEGEYCRLERNPLYYAIDRFPNFNITTDTNSTSGFQTIILLAEGFAIGGVTTIVAFFSVAHLLRKRRSLGSS